ncbi:hypothetical protein PMAYCL1PPCAC_32039, partial [Pristionchus mayeri]
GAKHSSPRIFDSTSVENRVIRSIFCELPLLISGSNSRAPTVPDSVPIIMLGFVKILQQCGRRASERRANW